MFRLFTSKDSRTPSPEDSGEETDQSWENAPECCVCFMPFTASKRRHHCRVCQHSVCDLHSLKRTVINSTAQRVCDSCERKRFEEEIKLELAEVWERRKRELEVAKKGLEMTERDMKEKEREIGLVLQKRNECLLEFANIQKQLEDQLAEEELKYQQNDDLLSSLTSKLKSAKEKETDTCGCLNASVKLLGEAQENLAEETEMQDSVFTEVNLLTAKANKRVDWEKALEVLCKTCKQKLKRPFESSQCEMRNFSQLLKISRTSSL